MDSRISIRGGDELCKTSPNEATSTKKKSWPGTEAEKYSFMSVEKFLKVSKPFAA